MALTEIPEQKPADDARSRWIGIYVGVLAALLAICTMGGGNSTKDATRANIDATNTWSFFQAKNIRRTVYSVAADDLDLLLKANPGIPSEARQAIEEKIRTYRADVARYTSDKKTNEGLDELFARAKAIEAERDLALRRDPYFDLSQAMLQIAIVLASVALIAGGNLLLYLSAALGVAGTALMLNGFTLLVKLPWLG
jgi:hypothetical protein